MTPVLRGVTVGVWEALAWGLWLFALAKVARTPARQFARGWWTKTGRIIVAFFCYSIVGDVFVPWGAALVLIALHRAGRQPAALDLAPRRGPDLPE